VAALIFDDWAFLGSCLWLYGSFQAGRQQLPRLLPSSGLSKFGDDVDTLGLWDSSKEKNRMGSNLVNAMATQCHPARRQYAQETFLTECRVNDQLCLLLHHLVETTNFLVHNQERDRSISAEENFQASNNSDYRSPLQ